MLSVLLPVVLLVASVLPASAQSPSSESRLIPTPVAPSVQDVQVRIERGEDVVQAPSLWYQEGNAPPDSLGLIGIPRGPHDRHAVTFRDARYGFDVNLQHATLMRNGDVTEVRISPEVLRGERTARFIIRPPADDFYDVAYPAGIEALETVPGEQTVIDVYEWYTGANSRALSLAPVRATTRRLNDLPLTRELHGKLQSTAPGGERVSFYLTVRQDLPLERTEPRELALFQPISVERPAPQVTRREIVYRDRPSQAKLEWITRVGFMAGANRATLPRNPNREYSATRGRGDITTALRWHTSEDLWFQAGVFAISQPTISSDGDHHDVPYGAQFATRIGQQRAFMFIGDAALEDTPFQQQNFGKSDQRLRMLMGVDVQRPGYAYRVVLGPTYFRDRPSIFETRPDARQAGVSLLAQWVRPFQLGAAPLVLDAWGQADQSWGFITDAGSANTQGTARLALRYRFDLGISTMELGPVLMTQHHRSRFDGVDGISEWSVLGGIELKTNVRLFSGL
ncbi:hypothetical protein CRI93_04645 [Longimonas halophila]|uniref:Uncharacterized protein n=1 Tax=Longimonas halophila TaxID=1469170 RepID=A0A2H3NND7_9BACT|nr:hypothetical protein CRI93_04645 [Longimonas halophila]